MRTGLSAFVVALILLFVAQRAEAGKFDFKAAKVTVDVPSGWTTDDQGGYVTFGSKDQSLAINLAVAAGTDIDAAWDLLISEVKKVISGFSADRADGILGAMTKGYVGHGAGTMGGTSVEALVAVFKIDGGSLTIFAIGEKGKYEKHEKAMTQLLNGIAPVPSGAIAEDESWAMVPKDGQKLATKLVTAIVKNDSKGFVKMIGKKGVAFFDGETEVIVKTGKVKAAVKKAGGVAAFVGMPGSGDFHVLFDAETGTSFSIYRGEQVGVVTYLHVKKEKKKWVVTGTWMQDHTTDDGGM